MRNTHSKDGRPAREASRKAGPDPRFEGHGLGDVSDLPEAFREALAEYIFHLSMVRAVSKRTVEGYGRDLVAMVRHLAKRGRRGPAQVTPADLQEYVMSIHEAGRQPATVARARSSMRSFFLFLNREGILQSDPASDLDAPRGWQRVPRALTEDQAAALVESVRGDRPLDLRDRALLELAYGTGGRVSELLDLRLDDVLWEERLVRLTGKGARTRLVPLGGPAIDALRAYTVNGRPRLLEKRRSPLAQPAEVLLNARGGRLSRMGFWKILRKRSAEAGLDEGIHPHLLRHTYATHLLRGGASLRIVQELLGHARLATTQIYTSVDEQYLQEMHRQFHPRG